MRLFTWSFGLAAVSLGAVLAACSGGQSTPQTDGPPADSASAAAPMETAMPTAAPTAVATTEPMPTAAPTSAPTAPAKPAWDTMNFDQRKEFMKTTFMPALTKDFQEYDAKKYKDVSCVLCHGAGAKDGKFKMPNPGLPKLNPKDGFKKHMTKNPKMTQFMMAKVVGDSATTLGVPPFDMTTHQGFGCGGCHIMEEK